MPIDDPNSTAVIDPPVNVQEVPCAGGCGAQIQVPEAMAAMVRDGKTPAPRCLACLRLQRKEMKEARRGHKDGPQATQGQGDDKAPARDGKTPGGADTASRAAPGSIPGGAPGPAPADTILVMTRKHQRPKRGSQGAVGYTIEVHPSLADRDVPEWQILAWFSRALMNRIRHVQPPTRGKGPRGEGLGFRGGRTYKLPKGRADRMAGIAERIRTGVKLLRRVPGLAALGRGKEEDGDGGS